MLPVSGMDRATEKIHAGHWSALRAYWPEAVHRHVDLVVDDPFLSGERQTLMRDGRIGEICYVLYRGDPRQGVLLHVKRYYPAAGFRLPTGGIMADEEPLAALVREVEEETGIRVDPEGEDARHARVDSCLGLITYHFQHRRLALSAPFASYVFVVRAPANARIAPQDETEEVTGWRWHPPHRLLEVAATLNALHRSDAYWGHWGNFRAVVHAFTEEHWHPY